MNLNVHSRKIELHTDFEHSLSFYPLNCIFKREQLIAMLKFVNPTLSFFCRQANFYHLCFVISDYHLSPLQQICIESITLHLSYAVRGFMV